MFLLVPDDDGTLPALLPAHLRPDWRDDGVTC
jgi:hypothetical protein